MFALKAAELFDGVFSRALSQPCILIDEGRIITTVRDLGDRGFVLLPFRGEFAPSPVADPDRLLSGPPTISGRGYCRFLGGGS